MSRSRKKPIVKDSGCGTKWIRANTHRRMRRAVRDGIHHGKWDLLPEDESEFVNDFDICDNRWDMRWEQNRWAGCPDCVTVFARK